MAIVRDRAVPPLPLPPAWGGTRLGPRSHVRPPAWEKRAAIPGGEREVGVGREAIRPPPPLLSLTWILKESWMQVALISSLARASMTQGTHRVWADRGKAKARSLALDRSHFGSSPCGLSQESARLDHADDGERRRER